MKRSIIFAATICASIILGTSCIKENELSYEDKMRNSAITLYLTGADHHGMTMGPAFIALRLNTLLYEASQQEIDITDDDAIVNVTIGSGNPINCRSRLFGNATFEIDTLDDASGNIDIKIKYPFDYASGLKDYSYRGQITFRIDGKYLTDGGGSSWSALSSGSGMSKFRRASTYGSDICFDWEDDSYNIDNMEVSAYGFLSYYNGKDEYKDNAAEWDLLGYSFNPGTAYYTKPSYENYLAMELTHGGSSYGSIIKSSATETPTFVYYRSVGNLVTKMSCGMTSIKSGEEEVKSTDFTTINPESFPESTVTVEWAPTNENCGSKATIRYAGLIL